MEGVEIQGKLVGPGCTVEWVADLWYDNNNSNWNAVLAGSGGCGALNNDNINNNNAYRCCLR